MSDDFFAGHCGLGDEHLPPLFDDIDPAGYPSEGHREPSYLITKGLSFVEGNQQRGDPIVIIWA